MYLPNTPNTNIINNADIHIHNENIKNNISLYHDISNINNNKLILVGTFAWYVGASSGTL